MSCVSSYFNWNFPSSDEPGEKIPDDSIKSEVDRKAEIKIVRMMKVWIEKLIGFS